MRKVNGIAIHCSATRPGMDIGVKEITDWHRERGFTSCGYHFVIRRDGTIETGRDQAIPGAHVKGHNATTIGVCLVGGVNDGGKPDSNFTKAQWMTLAALVGTLTGKYPGAEVKGHRDYPGVKKACPSFDVGAWWG